VKKWKYDILFFSLLMSKTINFQEYLEGKNIEDLEEY